MSVDDAARALSKATSALFITGAGLSADSGLPTYRGIGGLYNDGDTDEGIPIEVALSGQTMRENPALCWKYIAQVEKAGRGALPNAGHEVIAKLESKLERVVVLTQNVDGLHRTAGSSDIIDIHGDVRDLICTQCSYGRVCDDYAGLEVPPSCPNCGAVLRPAVVLFGEALDPTKVGRLITEVERGFDVVFSIGTTSLFPYIAQPFVRAAADGRTAIEINPTTTAVTSEATIKIAEGAAKSLEAIWSVLG